MNIGIAILFCIIILAVIFAGFFIYVYIQEEKEE